MRRWHGRALPGVILAFLVLPPGGCFGNMVTVFPEGLEPVEEVTVAPPDPVGSELYPETFRMEAGSAPEYSWTQLRGYVHAPRLRVYEAMRTPEACLDARAVDEWSVEQNVESQYEFGFLLHNRVHDIITVDFDVTWRFGVVEGSAAAPTLVIGTWQKTWGTIFIKLMRGHVMIRPINSDITEIEMAEHLRAAQGGSEPTKSFFRDYFANIVALAHGRPLPKYK